MKNQKELQEILLATFSPMMVDRFDVIIPLTLVLATFIAYARWGYNGKTSSERSDRRRLPPGPPAMWLIGNLLRMPRKNAWLTFTQWKKTYGPLVYLHGLGNSILVLNTQKAISDLLDKRGSNYSHRPVLTVAGALMGLDNSMPILPYGNEWRFHRKLAHTVLSIEAVKKYHEVQEDLAALMCRDFLEKPKDFFAHVRLTAGRVILAVTYGLTAQAADDNYIAHAEETMEVIGKATVPGAYLVDLFPSLRHLPSWFPFTTFHQDGLKGRQMIDRLITDPFEHVRREMSTGTASPSFTHDLLDEQDAASEVGLNEFENSVKWVAGAMYGAGGETTYTTVLTLMLAMAMYPGVQKKAQREIDEVVGTDRLPVIEDRSALPYVNAVIKETMRWHPALPLSIARRSAKDDVYEGYFIPEGTIVIPNVWAISCEDESYPPTHFVPERFQEENGIADPHSYAFGFGRRICPGKYLGDNSVFVLIASILASFSIYPPVDEEGKELPMEPKFAPDLVSYPEPYKCRIIPRSAAKAQLVKDRASSSKV